MNRGRLGPKGLNQWYANRHATRALHPLIRSGTQLLRASWDDAMDLMVHRFNEAMALLKGFAKVKLVHVPREMNTAADEMSNRAIDEK